MTQVTDKEVRERDAEAQKHVSKLAPRAQWPFVPRQMTEDDEPLVYGTWLRSLRPHQPYKHMRHALYRELQSKVIRNILDRPTARVLIAAHPDGEPKFGWVCYEKRRGCYFLHYIYVRSTFRQHNVASALLQFAGIDLGKDPVTATHWTKAISYHWERWNLNFSPELAWEATSETATTVKKKPDCGIDSMRSSGSKRQRGAYDEHGASP